MSRTRHLLSLAFVLAVAAGPAAALALDDEPASPGGSTGSHVPAPEPLPATPDTVLGAGATTDGVAYEIASYGTRGGGLCLDLRRARESVAASCGPSSTTGISVNIAQVGQDLLIYPLVGGTVNRIEVRRNGTIIGRAAARSVGGQRLGHVAVRAATEPSRPARSGARPEDTPPPFPFAGLEVRGLDEEGNLVAKSIVPAPPTDEGG